MAGRKFGAQTDPALTWAMNVHVPAIIAETFSSSRIVVFSTGCVYPFVAVSRSARAEDTPLLRPANTRNSCVGRERMFEYFSQRYATPGRLFRLNYAIDMRYGVLFDIARKVRDRQPIDVDHGSRQRNLAGRCQRSGATLLASRDHADDADSTCPDRR